MAGTSLMAFGDAFDRSSRSGRELQRSFGRALDRAQAEVALTALHEDARAQLANTVLQNVGALSSLEQHLAQTVPAGTARYAAIVNAYTAGAANTLLRW